MTAEQKFKSAIKRGTGEAHLIMKANPCKDFSKDIIKAALKNLSYDNQAEGSRDIYIFELIELSNKKEQIRKAILRALSTERKDTWALEQLFDIAALFAKQGDDQAKKAIYNRYFTNTITGSEWVGQDALIEADGLNGLKYIAKVTGRKILEATEWREDSFLIDDFKEKNQSIDVDGELEKSAKDDPEIQAYLEQILKNKHSIPKRERPIYNYNLVTDRIDKKVISPLPTFGAKTLSKDDIKKIADDFLKETDRLRLEKYMRVFDKVEYPFDYHSILKLAQAKYSKEDRLVEFAVNALRYFKGKDIRDFALTKIPKSKRPDIYTGLLIGNYKNGDAKLLKNIIDRTNDEVAVHALVYSYIDIYNKNKTKECKGPLTALYNKLTCGMHRKDIVKIMIGNKVLPKKVVREIEFDSYDEIRKLSKPNF